MRSNFFMIGVVLVAGGIFGSQYISDNWDQLKGKIPTMPDVLKENLSQSDTEKNSTSTAVYKWQDADGNWQFGDKPPKKGTFEVTSVEGVQSIEMYNPPPKISGKESDNSESTPSITPLTPFTDPEKVKKIMDDARNVEKLLQDRKQVMDEQIDRY